MNLKKTIQTCKTALAYSLYRLTSKRKMRKIETLFDTPNMSKYHHILCALRYVAVEEYYGENDFGKELFLRSHQWESEAVMEKHMKDFWDLIESIKTKGFQAKYPIYVDLNGNCINGTHRLAICSFFGIDEISVITIRRHLKPPTLEEMKAFYRLSDENYQRLDEAYQRMRARLLKQ